MTARTHDMIAFAFLVTAAAYLPPSSLTIPTLFTSLVGNIVGGLIPDMDQASNKLWDLLPGSNFTGRVFRHLFIGHRTISHSIVGGVLLYKLLLFSLPRIFNGNYVDTNVLLISIMLGFISHLFADGLTKEGIPLFFPFKVKVGFPPFRFLRITTDTWMEHLIVLPAVVVYIGYVFVNHQTVFLTMFHQLKYRFS